MALKKRTKEYLSWHDDIIPAFEKATKKKYGRVRDYRNWADKKYTGSDKDNAKPYQDFWHWMIDGMDTVGNGSMWPWNFAECYEDYKKNGKPEDAWILEILEILAEVVGDEDVDVEFSW